MKIQLLSRSEIDESAWNNCVQKYSNGLPYALIGYLDQVSNQQWTGLIAKHYEYVFPLPFEVKLRQLFYTQPFLTQQLGLIGPAPSQELFMLFLNKIPANFASLQLKIHQRHSISALSEYQFKVRTNLILDLGISYPQINRNYSKSLRKRIKQSQEYYSIHTFNAPDEIVSFYRTQLEERIKLGAKKYEIALRLLEYLLKNDLGFGIAARNKNKDMEACLFLAKYQGRIINLFGASNERGRKNYGMHFLLDHTIQKFSASGIRETSIPTKNIEKYIFDFEGSDLPGVKEFYQSFGAKNEGYLELNKDARPGWFKLLQAVKNKFHL